MKVKNVSKVFFSILLIFCLIYFLNLKFLKSKKVVKTEITLLLTYLSYQQDKSNIERNNYNQHK